MRRSWRYLRNISEDTPELYAGFAYFFLKNFRDSDGLETHNVVTINRYDINTRSFVRITKTYDRFSNFWTFNHILYGNSKRYSCKNTTSKWYCAEGYEPSDREPEEREEAFPELWENDCLHAFNLLLESECKEVNAFAIKVLADKFPDVFIKNIGSEEIKKILSRNYIFVSNKLIDILKKNFNPEKPDREIIMILLNSKYDSLRSVAKEWLKASAKYWKDDVLLLLLSSEYEDNRNFTKDIISIFRKIYPEKNYFYFLLSLLKRQECDFFSNIIEILKTDFQEELKFVSTEQIFDCLKSPSGNIQDFGVYLLNICSVKPENLDRKELLNLCSLDLFELRKWARESIKILFPSWERDISIFIPLAESSWEDTRTFAFEFLKENFSPEEFTPDIILSFCDSMRKDAQDFGKELMASCITACSDIDYILKLSEHPDSNIQEFALELIMKKMPSEPEKIKSLLYYFRTVLFKVNKNRKLKDKLLDYLEMAGLENPFAGAEIVSLLSELARIMTKKDFSRALVIMTGIKSRYPYITCPVEFVT